nr:hypothetical protein GOBAR_AA27993 [Ipomoea trifida]
MPMCNSSSPSSSSSTKSWLVHALVAGAAVAVAFGTHRYFLRSGKFRSRVIRIIPARFASTRFPGKPLVDILGKPMIQVARAAASTAAVLPFCRSAASSVAVRDEWKVRGMEVESLETGSLELLERWIFACLSTSTLGMPGAEVPAGLSYVPGSISV